MFQPLSPAQMFLRSQHWFAALAAQHQAELDAAIVLIEGSRGEVMLNANEPVQGWYGVVSGLAKLQSKPAAGGTSVFLGMPPGQWFGEGSVIKRERRRYEVVALRDTVLACLPTANFLQLYETHIPFNHALVQHLNMRLGQAMADIETSRLRKAPQRVALHLSRLFWHGIKKLDLSQDELSALVGLSRQTANAALQELERLGLVSLQLGRINVINDDGLLAYIFGSATVTPDVPPQG